MQGVFDNLLNIVETWWGSFQENLPQFVAGLVVLLVSMWLARIASRLVKRSFKRRGTDPEMSILVERAVRWAVIILGIVLALEQAGQDVSALVAGLGILGFTVGFALQDISKNFVAGILLLIEQPFDIGDTIEVSGYTGMVKSIDLRATRISTLDGLLVVIPNSDIFTNSITNYSRTDRRRVELALGVAYESELEGVRQVALDTVKAITGVLDDPAPSLVYRELGDSAVIITLYYWLDLNSTDYLVGLDAGVVGIKKAFEEAGIDMPFPTQTVHVRQG